MPLSWFIIYYAQMEMKCLLLTRDDQVIRAFRRMFEELGISLEVFTGADKAAEEMERRKFDAILLDCDDVHNAITVLCSVRLTASNKTSTVFAIVNGITTVTTAIDLGANLALEKPIDEYKARHALKSVHSLMLQERRRYYRHSVDIAVTLLFEEKDRQVRHEVLATAVNLSEGGMAVKVKSSIPTRFRTTTLKFVMPGSQDWVSVSGSIAWADEVGNAGIRFENLPNTLRDRLSQYLRQAEQKQKEQAPGK
jgi:CheY-like chemotaxis protein